MKFVKLQVTPYRMERSVYYGWVILIDSLDELLKYEQQVLSNRIVDGFNGSLDPSHVKTRLGNLIRMRSENRGKSLVVESTELSSTIFLNMERGIINFGKIYIQRTGGYMVGSKGDEILDMVERENFIFPSENEVRYIKWSKGTHWYVKVDNVDVVVSGVQKWDTRQEAEEAYESWKQGQKV